LSRWSDSAILLVPETVYVGWRKFSWVNGATQYRYTSADMAQSGALSGAWLGALAHDLMADGQYARSPSGSDRRLAQPQERHHSADHE
jgi:hypothetical protein